MAGKNQRKTLPARLCLDFLTPEALAKGFNDLKAAGFLPEDAGVYEMDGLDIRTGGAGIPHSRTYVVRKIGTRQESARLRVKQPEEEMVV
jgi:hypothetical protein